MDETGLLTVIETKLRKNPEARREVVGQVLEYAAQISTWSSADIEARATKFLTSDVCSSEYKGQTFEHAVRAFLAKIASPQQAAFSYSEFLGAIATNLEQGHIRLIITIDEPSAPLLRTIEFVNRFSQHFEMYLMQLKRFRDQITGQYIFVPALFGNMPTVAIQRTEHHGGDERSFFEDLEQRRTSDEVGAVRQLYDLAKAKGRIQWRTENNGASFLFQIAKNGKWFTIFNVHANQGLWINFGSLRRGGLTQEVLHEFLTRLNAVDSIAIPEHVTRQAEWHLVALPSVAESKSLQSFKDATLWLCNQIGEPVPA
ncbi:MAG: hypothetical protein HYX89_00030 [Chloroflexi bacterium]|nr:hypothetical protein [Chloroflexota bacterium]